jgi:hypothetical protein
MLSPGLRKFLTHHPEAIAALNAKYEEATQAREISILYEYVDVISPPRALHASIDLTHVVLIVKEGQQPLDELIEIFYELQNSERDEDFQIIFEEAASGSIERGLFPIILLREEFRAYPSTRHFVNSLNLSKRERLKSLACTRYMNCPDEFEAFRTYCWGTNYVENEGYKSYETNYDALRHGTNAINFR